MTNKELVSTLDTLLADLTLQTMGKRINLPYAVSAYRITDNQSQSSITLAFIGQVGLGLHLTRNVSTLIEINTDIPLQLYIRKN
jgi:hypothetical protein